MLVDDDAPYMVFEYMEHGDLADLLRRNDPAIGSGPCKAVELKQVRTTIGFCLIYMYIVCVIICVPLQSNTQTKQMDTSVSYNQGIDARLRAGGARVHRGVIHGCAQVVRMYADSAILAGNQLSRSLPFSKTNFTRIYTCYSAINI